MSVENTLIFFFELYPFIYYDSIFTINVLKIRLDWLIGPIRSLIDHFSGSISSHESDVC